MKTLKAKTKPGKKSGFAICNGAHETLFTVREGVDIGEALNQAQCLMEAAREATDAVVDGNGGHLAAAYLVEAASAALDAVVCGIATERAKEARHGR